ncbi:MAG: glutaredoxin 3 [Steroidobacteraceae bacterium]|jgi:glutaredoxin 3
MSAAKIVMYSSNWCPYCLRARRLLQSKGVAFEEIDVDADPQRRQDMRQRSGRHTVPQIFIGARHVGGCDDLHALDAAGQLDPLIFPEVTSHG